MNILETKFRLGSSSGSGGSGGGVTTAQLDEVKTELSAEIDDLWDNGVGANADNIIALVEKLSCNSTTTESNDESVTDPYGGPAGEM